MRSSKVTVKTSEQTRAARRRGISRTDWERVRRESSREPGAAEFNLQIGPTIARIRGRPVGGAHSELPMVALGCISFGFLPCLSP